MVKVAHILTNLALGGPQGWTVACVQQADQRRFEVHVIAGARPDAAANHEDRLQVLGERLHLLPALGRSVRPVRDLQALVALARILRREQFDVVHTHMWKAGVLGRIAAWAACTPVVAHTAHGWSFWSSPSGPAWRVVRSIERLVARRTDVLFLVSDHDRRVAVEDIKLPRGLLADGRQGVRLLPAPSAEGRSAARRLLGLPAEGPVVGTVTRLVAEKRVGDFVQAAAVVQDHAPETTFVIVGSGRDESALRTLADRLNVKSLVWRPTRPDVLDVLPAFDVFVHPSNREGLPMTVLEALSAGVPVVAEDAGGTCEVIRDGETGILVPIGDVSGLASGIVRLLSSPELAARLQSGGRLVVEQRHLQLDRVRALEQQYLELLSRPSAVARTATTRERMARP